jgi:hypothetical protein
MQRLGWFLGGEDGMQALTEALSLPSERSGFTLAFVYLTDDAALPHMGAALQAAKERGVPILRASEDNETSLPDFDLAVVTGDASYPTTAPMLRLSHAPPERNGASEAEEIWRAMEDRASAYTVNLLVDLPQGGAASIATSCRFALQGREWDPLWRQFFIKLKNEDMEEIKLMGEDEPLFRHIQNESRKHEVPLIGITAKLFEEGMASIIEGKLMRDGAPQERGLDLSAAVESALVKGGFAVD